MIRPSRLNAALCLPVRARRVPSPTSAYGYPARRFFARVRCIPQRSGDILREAALSPVPVHSVSNDIPGGLFLAGGIITMMFKADTDAQLLRSHGLSKRPMEAANAGRENLSSIRG